MILSWSSKSYARGCLTHEGYAYDDRRDEQGRDEQGHPGLEALDDRDPRAHLECRSRPVRGERLLFTNFGSKLGLFNAALVEPLKGVVADFLAVKHSEELSVEARLGVLIGGLYDIAREHRSALRSVLGAGGGAEADGLRAELFAEIAAALQQTVEKVSSYPHVDSRAAMIDLAGMVFGVALLDDMLIEPRSRRPSRARLLNEMTKMAAARLNGHGETNRTDGG